MSEKRDTITKSEYLTVFAGTGHHALNALLLASGGSVVAFMGFLGSILGSDSISETFGPESLAFFVDTLRWLLVAVVFSLLSYAASFASHARFYNNPQSDKLGGWLTWTACFLGLACIVCLLIGGWVSLQGLEASKAYARAEASMNQPKPPAEKEPDPPAATPSPATTPPAKPE